MDKILIIISIFLSTNVPHDIAIAIFKVYEENNKIELEIRMDAIDLSEATNVEVSQLNNKNTSAYLKSNLSFRFGDTPVSYIVESLEFEGDHVIINTTLSSVPTEYKSIDINNSCLTHIKGHSNIMQMELKNKTNDYRMHLDRQHITVEY